LAPGICQSGGRFLKNDPAVGSIATADAHAPDLELLVDHLLDLAALPFWNGAGR